MREDIKEGKFGEKARAWIAKQLVGLAFKIHGQSPEVIKFLSRMSFEAAIKGQAIIKIDQDKLYENPNLLTPQDK